MPIYHATMYFAAGTLGWREQLFRRDPDISVSLAACLRLAQARYSILGRGVSLYRVAVSQVGRPGVSTSALVGGQTLPGLPMPLTEGAEIRLYAGSGGLYHRTYSVRGLPIGALVRLGGGWQWGAAISGAAVAWLQRLVVDGWMLQCWGRSGPAYPLVALVEQASVPDGLYPTPAEADAADPYGQSVLAVVAGIVDPPPPSPDTGELGSVRIGGARWAGAGRGRGNGANGTGAVLAVSGDAVVYQGRLPAVGEYAGGGTLTIRPRLYVPIASWSLQRLGVRAVGPARRDAVSLTATAAMALQPGLGAPEAPLPGPMPAGLPPGILTPYATPAGVVPVPPPPVVPPPVPPPPPGPYVPEPQPPRAVTLRHLGDVGTWMIQTVAGQSPGDGYTPIMIGRALNLVDTYAVLLYGQQPVIGGTAGALASIGAGLHAPTAYLTAAVNAIERYVPASSQILLYGYSLGGIIAELIYADPDYTARIVMLATLASPVAGIPFFRPPILRFRVGEDLVPDMTPLGFLASILSPIIPLYTFLAPDPAARFFPGCHTQFPLHPELAAYDAFGLPGQAAPPVELGPLTTLPVPPL